MAGALSAGAQDQSLQEARDQREAMLGEKARVAEQLKTLNARSDELRAALAGLDEALAFQGAKVETARQVVAQAESVVEARRREAADTAEHVARLRVKAGQTVINAYIGAAGGNRQDALFTASNVNELVQKQRLLDLVEGNLHDDLDQLRALIEDQRRAEAQAEVAVAQAERSRAALADAQAELQRQRDTQGRLEDALRASIADWQTKADQLDAAEKQLDAIIQQRLAEEAAANGVRVVSVSGASSSGFIYPVDAVITSDFGWRRHPVLGTLRLHAGTDFGADYGADVWASKAGVVIFAGWNGGYGNCVMIEHAGGIVTLYGHMSELFVSEGQEVAQGTVIGAVGSTGLSTGPHLHFETRVGGEPQDPMGFLD